MTILENDPYNRSTEGAGAPVSTRLSRRGFFGGLGGVAAAALASGMIGLEPLANAAAKAEAASPAPAVAGRRIGLLSRSAWTPPSTGDAGG